MIKRAGSAPIIVGLSAPGFAAMRSLARSVMEAGAAGVMIAPVPTLRTDDQITGYFRQAVEAIGADIPWVLQDYPLTLTVLMTPGVIRRIIEDNPSCQMLKHEDWPGLEKISALRGFQKDGSMRAVSRFRDGTRRGRGDDGLRVPRHAGRRGAAFEGGPSRRRARSVRRAPSAPALRAAAGRRLGGAQVRDDATRRHRLR